ncbi:hypothetical protein HK102_008685, partial [Quaeritorhiza haematococci]
AEYIQNVATKFADGSLTNEKLLVMSDEEVSTELCAIKGIGQWTVDMFLIFSLRRPDILPVGDLGIRKAMSTHFELKGPKNKKTTSRTKVKAPKKNGIYLPSVSVINIPASPCLHRFQVLLANLALAVSDVVAEY